MEEWPRAPPNGLHPECLYISIIQEGKEAMTMQGAQNSYQEYVDFLNKEADLLDSHQYRDWLDLLTDDVVYRIPIRTTRDRHSEKQFSEKGYHVQHDRSSIEARIEQLETEFDWSEIPPSRTRHFVSNIKVEDVDGDEVLLRDNVLLRWAKGETESMDELSGERHDTLRLVDGDWKLAKRIVYLDHTVLSMENTQSLSIFV